MSLASLLLSASLLSTISASPNHTQIASPFTPSLASEALFAGQLPQATSVRTQAVTYLDASRMVDGVMDLRLELSNGGDQALRLEVNDSLFSKEFKLVRNGESVDKLPRALPLRGYVVGDPDSWARITFIDGQPEGLLYVDGELQELRMKEGQLTLAPSEFALTGFTKGSSFCGLTPDSVIAKELVAYREFTDKAESSHNIHSGQNSLPVLDTCYEIDVALIQDHTYIGRHGSEDNADDRTTAIYNEVQRIFQNAINVSIRLTGIESMPTPGSSEINPAGGIDITSLLMNLAAYKASGADPHASDAGLTQLLTVRYQAGSSASPVGLAYKGTTCVENMGYSAAVISDVGDLAWSVATHETGHNFNSPHDGDGSDACGGEPSTGFIMQPIAAPASDFSECSKRVMNEHISEVVGGTSMFRQPNCYHPCFGCGNGIVEEGEECDDRNYDNNDDCRNDCTEPPPPPPPTTGEEDDAGTGDPDPSEGGGDSDGGQDSSDEDSDNPSSSSNGDSGSSSNNSDSSGGSGDSSDEDEEGGFGSDPTDEGELDGGTFGESGGFGDATGFADEEGSRSGGCQTTDHKGSRTLIFAVLAFIFMTARRRLRYKTN